MKEQAAKGSELVGDRTIFACREVFMSCGAPWNPQTLMLSGIGAESELFKHKTEQYVDPAKIEKTSPITFVYPSAASWAVLDLEKWS